MWTGVSVEADRRHGRAQGVWTCCDGEWTERSEGGRAVGAQERTGQGGWWCGGSSGQDAACAQGIVPMALARSQRAGSHGGSVQRALAPRGTGQPLWAGRGIAFGGRDSRWRLHPPGQSCAYGSHRASCAPKTNTGGVRKRQGGRLRVACRRGVWARSCAAAQGAAWHAIARTQVGLQARDGDTHLYCSQCSPTSSHCATRDGEGGGALWLEGALGRKGRGGSECRRGRRRCMWGEGGEGRVL